MWALTCVNGGLAATRYARPAATVHAGMLFPRTRTGRPALSSSTSPTCANTGSARPGMRGNRAEWPLRWLMRCADWPGPHGATVHAGTTRGRAWTRGRDHLCAARHELSGRCGGASGRPRFGDSRRLLRPPMRPRPSRARLIMRTTPSPVQPRGGDGGRDHLCGRSDTLRVTSTGSRQCGARPFMRSSDLALNCRLRPAADCPRTTGATAYAWITVPSDQRKRTARPFMRGQLAQQFADALQTACPTQ